MNWKELIENRNRFFWILHTGGWFGFALVQFLGSLLHDLRDIFVIVILLNTYAGWMLTVPLRYIYRRAWNLTPVKIAAVIIFTSFLTGMIWQIIKNVNYWEIYKHGWKPEFWLYYTQSSVWSFYIILSWSGLYFGIKFYQDLIDEKEKTLQATNLAQIAQLKMLNVTV